MGVRRREQGIVRIGSATLVSLFVGVSPVMAQVSLPLLAQSSSVSTEAPADPLQPDVLSPTHPNTERWYANNDPRFSWILPSDISGVSWLVHENPEGNPGRLLNDRVDEVSFEDVPDGLHYFHIKFQRDGVFGPTTHYPFRVDTLPPRPFVVVRTSADDVTDPRPPLTYTTTDVTSGIQQYRMRIGDGEWFNVPEAPADQPYRMPLQEPGTYTVTVEALDAAGMSARAQARVTVDSIQVPTIDEYPAQADTHEPLRVNGTAAPNSTVTLRAWRISPVGGVTLRETSSADVSVVASEGGQWTTVLPGRGVGKYHLQAVATDARGAVSYPSDEVTVRIGSWFVRQTLSLPYWYAVLPGWIQVLLIGVATALLSLLVWGGRRRRRRIVVGVKHGKKIGSGLELLIEDIEVEMVTINRLAKSRPLYPEERYLRTKLVEYRKILKKIARSSVKEKEKEKR